jgi:hypothetical protein
VIVLTCTLSHALIKLTIFRGRYGNVVSSNTNVVTKILFWRVSRHRLLDPRRKQLIHANYLSSLGILLWNRFLKPGEPTFLRGVNNKRRAGKLKKYFYRNATWWTSLEPDSSRTLMSYLSNHPPDHTEYSKLTVKIILGRLPAVNSSVNSTIPRIQGFWHFCSRLPVWVWRAEQEFFTCGTFCNWLLAFSPRCSTKLDKIGFIGSKCSCWFFVSFPDYYHFSIFTSFRPCKNLVWQFFK